MERNPPGFLIAVGILACWFALQFLMSILIYGLQPDLTNNLSLNIVINAIATIIVVQAVQHHTQLSLSCLFDDSRNRFVSIASLLFPPVGLAILGSFWWFSDIQAWVAMRLPVDEAGMAYLVELLSGGVVAFFALGVFAPVVEEVLFRGIILRGFLHHYSPALAITLSATLFAVFHFNLYQFLIAFVMGIFFGWLYYKSRSLWPCIFGHSVYNAGSYLLFDSSEEYQWNDVATNLFTFGLSVAGIVLLVRLFKQQDTQSTR